MSLPPRSKTIPVLTLWLIGAWLGLRAAPAPTSMDYEQPTNLPARILTMGAAPKTLLYRSLRKATRSGKTVNVTCEFTCPDGSLAARDRLVYEDGQLASCETEEFQISEKASAVIRRDPANPGKTRIFYEHSIGQGSAVRRGSTSESLENDSLIDDMIPGFIASHWTRLMKGEVVHFRYIALSRMETVGFKLSKESEGVWQGTPVARIRMEPTSFIIAQLIDPMFFVTEKAKAHRIFEYIGRTTPMIKSGSKWKDLDADTIFEWDQAGPFRE